MREHNAKIIIPLILGLALVTLSVGNACAQDNTINGKLYAIYFYTLPNQSASQLTHMHATFKDDGSIAVMGMDGHGLYAAVPGFFVGTYYVVGLRMGFETRDVFTGMTGISIDPLILGTGFFLIDYNVISPYVFSGFQILGD